MTTTATPAPTTPHLAETPAAPPVNRGIEGLRCPGCGETDSLRLCLDNGTLVCAENECELQADDIREQVAKLQAVLRVIEALPPI